VRVANLAHAAFCADCGARLSVAPPDNVSIALSKPSFSAADQNLTSIERRQLTVLFCDLVGSTALSSRLDPEDLRDVIGAYHRCIADTVEPLGGFVARYMGDGALVYFGYPQAFEDSAEGAVRAALELVSNVAKLNVLAERLSVRIGIATGLVVVGELVNAGAAREQTALGETPNLAARLQAIAKPDTVVIAETTRRLVGGLFEYRDLGAQQLKGFAAPWRLAGHRPGTVSSPIQCAHDSARPPLIAAIAMRAPDRSCSGLGLLLIAGRKFAKVWRVVLVRRRRIGKSRLVQALVSHLGEQPHAHLEFRCSVNYANSPLYPVVALLPTVIGWSEWMGTSQAEKLDAFCARHSLPTSEALPLLAVTLASASDRCALHR
jgi:class 3 adenylate cyclase